ncbi:MAG: hypothetical protein IKV66_13345 [Clostridia bacterium]|nr:hypothetical protein [Clostridia bacterium]
MKIKRLISVFLLLIMALSVTANAVQPRWTNTLAVTMDNAYDNGDAKLRITINAMSDADKIDNVDIRFYRVATSGTETLIASWNDLSVNDFIFHWTMTVPNVYKYLTYRLEFNADVHRNGVVETISDAKTSIYNYSIQ